MASQFRIPVARPLMPKLEAIAPYLARIDANRWYSNLGPLCLEFEARLAERFGLGADQLSTISNATVGLVLALQTAGARPGTHCLVPSWTFSASIHAVLGAGLIPLFADCDGDGLLTPEIARRALADRGDDIGAVMPVAVYGQPIDPVIWDAFAEETGTPVVLDVAPGYDAARPARCLSVVSLHATKIIGVGEGGFVMSTDAALVQEVRQRGNFGFRVSRDPEFAGTNAKLSEYAAAVGLAGLDDWQGRRAGFQAVADRYLEGLANLPGARLASGFGETWLAASCVLETETDAARLAASLAGAGVESRAWWGRGMHLATAFKTYPRLALPTTERLADSTLGLPFAMDMPGGDVDAVCGALRDALIGA